MNGSVIAWKKRSAKQRAEAKRSSMAIRVFICIIAAGLTLFAYIEKQNELTELRLVIPVLAKELQDIEQDNIRITYKIEKFQSPEHLIQLKRQPEYSHLKASYLDKEVILQVK